MSEILEPTGDVARWQSLVAEAEKHAGVRLDEELESYLVFTLMRWLRRPDMASRILALDFLESFHQQARRRSESLRDVGDQCLLYSGLFPERAERRRVRVSYYVDLGRSAYHSLADGLNELARLFERLAEEFVSAMDILQAIRSVGGQPVGLTPLQAHDLWTDTGSRSARAELARHTTAEPLSGNPRLRH